VAHIEFQNAYEVEHIARKCIATHHKHLVEANIRYLFRDGPWSSKDRTTWGRAIKVTARERHLTGNDFCIVINTKVWKAIEYHQQVALVDHELSHCGRKADDDDDGNPVWYEVSHSIEDFVGVIKRHGLWSEDVQRIARAIEQHQLPSLLDHGLEDDETEREEVDDNELPLTGLNLSESLPN